jgi:hypothetical protein
MGNMAIKIIIISICLILSYTKKPGIWLNTLNTFFHESFHALTALILGNKVKEIEFDTTTEGSCKSMSKSKLRTFFCSLSGYIGCGFFSLLLIHSIKHNLSHLIIITITIFSILILILYIKKTYPLVWTICFISINLAIILLPTPETIKKLILFIYSTIILIENTKACFTILYLSIFKPKKSGDCKLLSKITHIPAFVWGLIFNTINFYVIYKFLLNLQNDLVY